MGNLWFAIYLVFSLRQLVLILPWGLDNYLSNTRSILAQFFDLANSSSGRVLESSKYIFPRSDGRNLWLSRRPRDYDVSGIGNL